MLEGMKSMAASPYGFWTSPLTSDLVVADSIRLEQVALDGDPIYWTETQPQRQGRTFVYRIRAGVEPERVAPDDRRYTKGPRNTAPTLACADFLVELRGLCAGRPAGSNRCKSDAMKE
jgi:hypothetical protein